MKIFTNKRVHCVASRNGGPYQVGQETYAAPNDHISSSQRTRHNKITVPEIRGWCGNMGRALAAPEQ